jgi:CHAD domain-containing protein
MPLNNDQVLKPVRRLRKLLKKLPKEATPDQVHKLRTNTRRFEATLPALAERSLPKQRSMLKELSQVRKKAGKVRDMDVLIDHVVGLQADGEKDCKTQLLEHLAAKRRDQALKLTAVVRKNSASARRLLKKTSARLERLLCVDARNNCDPIAAPAHATAQALRLQAKLSEPPHLSRANLHPYRLQVKELRNLLRMAENSEKQEFVEVLGRVKDQIGEWHDWEELLAIANKLLDHTNCGLIREMKVICERRYQVALASAKSMRKKYLARKRGKRRAINTRTPAWTATASLAP